MDLRPLLAGIAVASGGAAVLCALSIRDLNLHSWGCYPIGEVQGLTVQLAINLLICLGALIGLTLGPKDGRVEGVMDTEPSEKKDDRFTWVDLLVIFVVGVFLGDIAGIELVRIGAITIIVFALFWLWINRPVRGPW